MGILNGNGYSIVDDVLTIFPENNTWESLAKELKFVVRMSLNPQSQTDVQGQVIRHLKWEVLNGNSSH